MLPRTPSAGGGRGGGAKSGASPEGPVLERWEKLPDGRYQGYVYGRKGYNDGDSITTGQVVRSTTASITTASGTTYRLGTPRRTETPKGGNNDEKPLKPPTDDVATKPNRKNEKDLDEWGGGLGDILKKNGEGGRGGKGRGTGANNSANGAGRGRRNTDGQYLKPGAPASRVRSETDPLNATLNEYKQSVYVGDRVRVKGTTGIVGGRGEVMYVGPAMFAEGRMMVGIKLDKPQHGSTHDGKENGERYFRCDPGYGAYVLLSDVDLIKRDGKEVEEQDDDDLPFDLEEALGELVGMAGAKAHLRSLRNRLEIGRKREMFGVKDEKPLHHIFIGSMGMDFKGLANILAGMLKDARYARSRKMHVVGRAELVGSSTDNTEKAAKEALSKASGGLLLIMDAGSLAGSGGGGGGDRSEYYGSVALNTILSIVAEKKDKNSDVILVFAVKRDHVASLVQACPNVVTLSPTHLELAEYSTAETVQLLRKAVVDAKFSLDPTLTDSRLSEILAPRLARCPSDKRGEDLVKRLVEQAIQQQTDRVFLTKTISKESLLQLKGVDFEDGRTDTKLPVEKVMERLDEIVGLHGVKVHIRALVAQLQLEEQRRMAGLPSAGRSTTLHMIFSGNPGTGKTTVARIVAEVLQSIGILRSGHCVETDRADLVAGYVGQTAIKVHETVTKALGGVLFVDEAYALVKDAKDTFGREALDTLIKMVEDHRDDLVVVLAGYPKEMNELISHNPGVKSRFPTIIEFEDYSVEELLAIADGLLEKQKMELDEGVRAVLEEHCKKIAGGKEGEDSGNGRAVRNMVERATRRQALRLVGGGDRKAPPTAEELCELTAADFDFV